MDIFRTIVMDTSQHLERNQLALDSSQQLARDRLAFEQRKNEDERKKWKRREEGEEREFQLRTEQLKLDKEKFKQSEESRKIQEDDRIMRKSLASRIKFYNDALKGTIGKLPTDSAQIPIYLNQLEQLFETVDIDPDIRASILLTNLTRKPEC